MDTDEDFAKGKLKAKLAKKFLFKKKKKKKKGKFKKFVKKKAGDVMLAPLFLFKPVMKKMLSKKGVSTRRMGMRDLTTKFYNTFVVKEKGSKFEAIDDNMMEDTGAFNIYADEYEDNAVGVGASIGVIVTSIVDFFKKRKAEKEAGKDQTPEDREAAKAAEKVAAALAKKAEEGEPTPKKDMRKMIMIGLAVAAVLVIFMVMKKK